MRSTTPAQRVRALIVAAMLHLGPYALMPMQAASFTSLKRALMSQSTKVLSRQSSCCPRTSHPALWLAHSLLTGLTARKLSVPVVVPSAAASSLRLQLLNCQATSGK